MRVQQQARAGRRADQLPRRGRAPSSSRALKLLRTRHLVLLASLRERVLRELAEQPLTHAHHAIEVARRPPVRAGAARRLPPPGATRRADGRRRARAARGGAGQPLPRGQARRVALGGSAARLGGFGAAALGLTFARRHEDAHRLCHRRALRGPGRSRPVTDRHAQRPHRRAEGAARDRRRAALGGRRRRGTRSATAVAERGTGRNRGRWRAPQPRAERRGRAQRGAATRPSGNEIVLPAGRNGHFRAIGQINGRSIEFMVDTGASVVSLGHVEADRLGLDYRSGAPGMARTANGVVPMRTIVLNSVRIGDVEVANVEAAVHPGSMRHRPARQQLPAALPDEARERRDAAGKAQLTKPTSASASRSTAAATSCRGARS